MPEARGSLVAAAFGSSWRGERCVAAGGTIRALDSHGDNTSEGRPMANQAARDRKQPESINRTTSNEDPGAFIGRKPERATETIPGGVSRRDERVSAVATQSGARLPQEDTPQGHRESEPPSDDRVREAG